MADIIPIKLAEQVTSAALGVTATAGGDTVIWNGDEVVILFQNTGGAALTVTIPVNTASTYDPRNGPLSVVARTIALAAGETKAIDIGSADFLLDGTGKIPLNYSAVTGLKVIALRP
jgi:hypothetical protein